MNIVWNLMRSLCVFTVLASAVYADTPPNAATLEVLYARGEAAYHQGDFRSSLKHMQELIRFQPAHVEGHYLAALSCYELGRVECSKAHLEKAVTLNEKLDRGLELLGVISLEEASYAEAEAYLVQANDLRQTGRRYLLLGRVHAAQGNMKKAESFYNKAIQKDGALQGDLDRFKGLDQEASSPAPRRLLHPRLEGVLSLGLEYDDNVILEPRSFNITNEGSSRLAMSAEIVYTMLQKKGWAAGFDLSVYRSAHENRRVASLDLSDVAGGAFYYRDFSLLGKPSRVELSYLFDKAMVGGLDDYSHSHAWSLVWMWEEMSRTYSELSYTFSVDRFSRDETLPDPDDASKSARDNSGHQVMWRQYFRLVGGQLQPSLFVAYAHEGASILYDLRSFQAGLGLELSLPADFSAHGEFSYEGVRYLNHPFGRDDEAYSVFVELLRPVHRQLDLALQFLRVDHQSNLSAYAYDRNVSSLFVKGHF